MIISILHIIADHRQVVVAMDKERSSLGRLGYSEFKDLIVSLKMWQVCPDHVLHGDHFDHVVHDDLARECSGRTPRRRRGCSGQKD